MMEKLSSLVSRIPIHAKIAAHAYPNGSVIRCLPCGKQRNCSTSEVATWIQIGFPKCKACGHATELVKAWK